jgi:hypothetical protein
VKRTDWTIKEDRWRRRIFGEDEAMMQLTQRVSLVIVVLLTSVGTASAECAWVL